MNPTCEVICRNRVMKLIEQDNLRMRALLTLSQLNLQSAYIAAGFVRNLIWDTCHGEHFCTPFNDVDVIYFDRDIPSDADLEYEQILRRLAPEFDWQVKNQAYMHERHQHQPYANIYDAMSYWPEQETAIAVRLLNPVTKRLEILSVFGCCGLFENTITHNQNIDQAIFLTRVNQKQWQKIWPKLTLMTSPTFHLVRFETAVASVQSVINLPSQDSSLQD